MKFLVAFIFLTIVSFGNNQKVTIIDNSVKRVVAIDNSKIEHNGFIIEFNKEIDIDKFEKKYHLKLKREMVIGLYVFANLSQKSDIELLENILNNDKDKIRSIFINSKDKNMLR